MTERRMRLGLSIRGHGYHPAAWRHPDVPADGTLHVEHYVRSVMATRELVAGFWLWEVKDMDEAVAWVKRCPNPMPGPSEIEIRPLYEMADLR